MLENRKLKKNIEVQKRIIEKLRDDISDLKEENEKLRTQLQLEIEKFVAVSPDDVKTEYQCLVEEILDLKNRYEEELKKLKALSSSYKEKIKKVTGKTIRDLQKVK